MPILSPANGITIGCDCSVAEGSRARSTSCGKDPEDEAPRRTAGSLVRMVAWWLEAIDSGVWGYDRGARRWTRHWETVPPERNGLV